VLAREGMLEINDDIAILASERLFKKNKARKANEIILGISLRGAQGEYGTENCLNELVDNIVYQSVACLVNEGRGRVINIEKIILKNPDYMLKTLRISTQIVILLLRQDYMGPSWRQDI